MHSELLLDLRQIHTRCSRKKDVNPNGIEWHRIYRKETIFSSLLHMAPFMGAKIHDLGVS